MAGGDRRLLASDEPLRPRTLQLYRGLLERIIYPVFRDLALRKVMLEDVEAWWDALPADTPTQNAHSYAMLRSLFAEAAKAGERPRTRVRANPFAWSRALACRADSVRSTLRRSRNWRSSCGPCPASEPRRTPGGDPAI